MYPILGRYGPFFLYSFTVLLGIGIGAGIALTAWKSRQVVVDGWLDALIASLLAGLTGARIGFVVAHWEYFQVRPSEMWQIWRGGLSYHGALFAGIFGLWVWSRWRRQRFLPFADLFAPALALATAIGWLACWFEGCAFGREAPINLLSGDLPDTFGIFAVRYQTQLLGLIISLFMFLLLLWVGRHPGSAALFWLALFGLSLGRLVVASMRGDTVPQIAGIRLEFFLDGAVALGSLILLQYQNRSPAFPETGN